VAKVSQEIKRGTCLVHNTQADEPFVIRVENDKVFYRIPDDDILHEMTLKEATDNYLIVDQIPETLIDEFAKF
jgi:hypothetical protein